MLQNVNWQLIPDALPRMQMELEPIGRLARATGIEPPTDFPDAGLGIPAHTSATLLLDHSYLTTAFPELTVGGGAKSVIRLTYAEALFDDQGEKGNRNEIAGKHIAGIFDEFLPDGSEGRRFMPLGWRTFIPGSLRTLSKSIRVLIRTTRR